MKKLVILGHGTGGTIMATKMRHKLPEKEWDITVIDQDWQHHYQPGWLFIPFGIYTSEDCVKPKTKFVPPGVNFVLDEIVGIDPENKQVKTRQYTFPYDWLVVATGCRIVPEEVEGMAGAGWGRDIHNFYTLDGAVALGEKMKYFEKGRVVLNIAELPFKCPVAPLEFVFMADWFFTINGVRDHVEIELVTPLPGAFTKPKAAEILGQICAEKNIKVTPNFQLSGVDPERRVITAYDCREVNYDLLVAIPPNFGAQCLIDSDMGDPMGYMDTDNNTLKSKKFENIYVIGDAANVPTSKAGSVAHYEADVLADNLKREIDGHPPRPDYDGHSTCYVVTGFDKGSLLDFNYKIEPLPGKFPFPGLGPFDLLGVSFSNYVGKMMFRWVYYNLMLKGSHLPLESQFALAGKVRGILSPDVEIPLRQRSRTCPVKT
jgi:sulfide:quinone oxidoreductase